MVRVMSAWMRRGLKGSRENGLKDEAWCLMGEMSKVDREAES